MKKDTYFMLSKKCCKSIEYIISSNVKQYIGKYYDDKLDINPRVEIGNNVYIGDNSFICDLETGKHVYLNRNVCDEFEQGAEFTIISSPYYDHVQFIGINYPVSYQFVDVQSTKTGKYYRVLAKALIYIN